MKVLTIALSGLLALGVAVTASSASASLVVLNSSFEAPDVGVFAGSADDWTQLGVGADGAGVLNGGFFGITVPDGDQVAFANPGIGLSQVLVDVLTADTLYKLTVAIGTRDRAIPETSEYEIRILAGGILLASVSDTLNENTPFSDIMVSYTATPADTQLGQLLQVEIATIGGTKQAIFDNVRLDATVVPEPSALLLAGLGILGLFGSARRRN